jgi:hypothetical protein
MGWAGLGRRFCPNENDQKLQSLTMGLHFSLSLFEIVLVSKSPFLKLLSALIFKNMFNSKVHKPCSYLYNKFLANISAKLEYIFSLTLIHLNTSE